MTRQPSTLTLASRARPNFGLSALLVASTILGGLLLPGGSLFGQVQRRISLGPSLAIFRGEFSYLSSLSELASGDVLVVENLAPALLSVSVARRDPRRVGREGDGPGEYRGLRDLFALGGDTTLVMDEYSGRFLLLVGDSVVRSVAAHEPANRRAHGGLLGADRRGQLLVVRDLRMVTGLPPGTVGADSQAVMLVDRRSARVDTVARIGIASPKRFTTPMPHRGATFAGAGNPFTARDQVMLAADGWLAIAYPSPYRVDWRAPDGRWVRGAPIAYERLPVTEREKCFALLRWDDSGGPCDQAMGGDWPAEIPPFAWRSGNRLVMPLLSDSKGRLVIQRAPSLARPGNRYDVVSRDGSLVGFLSLPTNELVLGFGRRGVYIVATDPDGLQQVRLHAWD